MISWSTLGYSVLLMDELMYLHTTDFNLVYLLGSLPAGVGGGGLTPVRGVDTQLVLTSSGGYCSGRYASYWNSFLLAGFITVCNVVATRLCFHRRVSFCSQGGGMYHSMHWAGTPLRADTPWANTPPPGLTPPGRRPLAQCMLGYTPPCPVHTGIHTHTRRPLQRTVRILLECILVCCLSTGFISYFQPFSDWVYLESEFPVAAAEKGRPNVNAEQHLSMQICLHVQLYVGVRPE